MMRPSAALCASCSKYPLEQAVTSGGRARCPTFEREYRFDSPACVLYEPARDREQRKQIVIQLMQQDANNACNGTQ